MSKNSKDDFYKTLFNILYNYFNGVSKVLEGHPERQVLCSSIGRITYNTYIALDELFSNVVDYDKSRIVSAKPRLEAQVTADGMVIDIKWKE